MIHYDNIPTDVINSQQRAEVNSQYGALIHMLSFCHNWHSATMLTLSNRKETERDDKGKEEDRNTKEGKEGNKRRGTEVRNNAITVRAPHFDIYIYIFVHWSSLYHIAPPNIPGIGRFLAK